MIDQHASLSEKFLKKGFWLYLFSFIIAPIWYIIKIILSWELTVSEVWILYGIISLITLISAYNDLWMSESLKHFIPQFVTEKRYDKVKSILFYALFTQISTSLLIAWFFYFWANYIAINYFKTDLAIETLKVFAFFFIWLNIFQTLNTFFMAVQDTFYAKVSDTLRIFFTMLSVLFVYLWDTSTLLNYSYTWIVWLYIWVLIIIYFFYTKYYKKYLKTNKIIIDIKLIKKIFKYSSMVFLWTSAWTILSQLDMQMIIYMLGTTEAWYYTNYLSIIWIPFILIWPIFAFLFPVFSELHSKKRHEEIKLIKWVFVKNFILLWVMFNIFFFIFAEIIAFTLFWEKFINSWIILKYSILLLIFNFLFQINLNILAWIWKAKERVKIILITIIFNFIMNLILINVIWVYWAALATWFGWILIWGLSEIFLGKKYYTWFDFQNIIKNVIIFWIIWTWMYYSLENYLWIKTIFLEVWINWLNFKNYLLELDRFISFIFLFIFFTIWACIFIGINYDIFKKFILEIKSLKK